MKLIFKLLFLLLLIPSLGLAETPSAQRKAMCADGICASTTNPIAASYSTLGYWSLGSLMNRLGGADAGGQDVAGKPTYFRLAGALIFILSMAAAIVMMGLGQPPKMYGWFAAGPALFYLLLFSSVERKGVRWELAHTVQDQEYVWQLATPGLSSNSLIKTTGGFSSTTGPSAKVNVPWLFAMVDDFASEIMQNFIGLLGVSASLSNIDGTDPTNIQDLNNWHLLSNTKWELLENITQSKIHNIHLREILIHFLASECGDKMGEYLNASSFAQASNTNGSGLPKTLFCEDPNDFGCSSGKQKLLSELSAIRLPITYSMEVLLKDLGPYSFAEFAFEGNVGIDAKENLKYVKTVSCDDLLWMVMQGFRWESGMSYWRIPQSIELQSKNIVTQSLIDYTFLYDWKIKPGGEDRIQTDEQRRLFMQDLLMSYMIRNELALAPDVVEQRVLPSDKASSFAEEFQRNINSKNKFAEFYTWAKLMPHMQGLLLYILSIGYPLACVFILVPGWWKWIFTWMSFYLWAKSWDVGFAVVMNIEKSIWANIGNSLNAKWLNERVMDFQDIHSTYGTCVVNGPPPVGSSGDCTLFQITQSGQVIDEMGALNMLDMGMVLSRSLNHDLANSYYIYIMSALYFAVPAITGQVMLGAKSGASQFVKEAVGGVSSEGGGAAKSGASADVLRHASTNANMNQQAAAAKNFRKEGLALKAIQAKNNAMSLEAQAGHAKALAGQEDLVAARARDSAQLVGASNDATIADARFWTTGVGEAVKTRQAFDLSDSADVIAQKANTEAVKGVEKAVKALKTGKSSPKAALSPGTEAAAAPTEAATGEGGGGKGNGGRKATIFAPSENAQVRTGLYQGWNSGLTVTNGWMDSQKASSGLKAARYSLDAGESARRANSKAGLIGHRNSNYARGYSEASGRLQQKAGFRAQEATYYQQYGMDNKMGGKLAAMGVVAGAISPKQKPMEADALMAGGYLGAEADSQFGYPTNGFFGEIDSQMRNMAPAARRAHQHYGLASEGGHLTEGWRSGKGDLLSFGGLDQGAQILRENAAQAATPPSTPPVEAKGDKP